MNFQLIHNALPELKGLFKLYVSCDWNRLNELSLENIENVLTNSSYYICAYSNKELVGSVRLFTDWTTRGFLCNLCVLPNYRRKGIGRSLMKAMIEVSDEKGIPVLNYSDFRNFKFYEDLGFKSEASYEFKYRLNPLLKVKG